MNRRYFLKGMAAGTATLGEFLDAVVQTRNSIPKKTARGQRPASTVSVEGQTLLCTFTRKDESWKVYEDLRSHEGVLTFVSSRGFARVLPKHIEAAFPEDGPQHLGLDIKEIGLADADLLADKLLAHGDPLEEEVRRAAPPMNSEWSEEPGFRPRWETLVGTSECNDTMPVYPAGNTRTYHPVQYFKELTLKNARKRYDGLIGGWLPAVCKVILDENNSYYDLTVFGDVLAKDRFLVQTWHRTAYIEHGQIVKVEYGYSYPAYGRLNKPPAAEEFYAALLTFVEYWEEKLQDISSIALPDSSWSDMARYAFVKEQIVRPGGVYPKYGAVDRDYYGPEYDGFQDTFTMSLYANLECGRHTLAHDIFDNYFTEFVDEKGTINMRGAETAQYGLMLQLVVTYYRYTKDTQLLFKHRLKIEAIANLLADMHEQALHLPKEDRGYGLIHGWCESDACLFPDPSMWWKPYFANSAFAIRGWRELSEIWIILKSSGSETMALGWKQHSDVLQRQLWKSIEENIRRDRKPPYIGPLPGTSLTFREAIGKDHPSEQGWAHRCYAELLQPDVLTVEQANIVIDCMRAYGATTIGVVANVEPANPQGRNILGFISYGYAQALLRLDRIEEYLLFFYAHRYHDHSRGSWTAAEVAGITGGDALFCIPAQMTIPLLLRWMLVFEESDGSCLHFGRAIPRAWIASGKPISIQNAATRWGRVSYSLIPKGNQELIATIELPPNGDIPPILQVRFRVPEERKIEGFLVNQVPIALQGTGSETVKIATEGRRHFEVVAKLR